MQELKQSQLLQFPQVASFVLVNELFEGLSTMAVELLAGLHGTNKVGLKL